MNMVDKIYFIDWSFINIRRTTLRRDHATETPEGAAMS